MTTIKKTQKIILNNIKKTFRSTIFLLKRYKYVYEIMFRTLFLSTIKNLLDDAQISLPHISLTVHNLIAIRHSYNHISYVLVSPIIDVETSLYVVARSVKRSSTDLLYLQIYKGKMLLHK